MNDQTARDGKHILVVNDSPAILDMFRELLEAEGYRVSLDSFSGLDVGQKHSDVRSMKPDLIVLDYLVGGDALGWQLLQLLKMDRATSGIPVVVCTAAVRQVEELGAHLREMNVGVVLKPFDIDDLLAKVGQALGEGTRR